MIEINEWNLTEDEADGLDSEGIEYFSHKKLLNYIKSNGKTLDELEATMHQLYEKFDIK